MPSHQSYFEYKLSLAPVWWSRLGEPSGATAADVMGVNNGTYVGAPTLGVASGVDDGDTAVTFPGSLTEYVTVPDNANLDFDTGPFSLEILYKCASASAGTFRWLMSKDTQFGWLILNNGKLLADNFVSGCIETSRAVDTDTLWHHAVFTRSGSTYRQYVDGVDLSVQLGAITFTASSLPMTVGIENAINGPWDGSLDEPAAYNYALSEAQAQRLNQLWRSTRPTVARAQGVDRKLVGLVA